MSWIWAALTPHPPVLVPEVGRGREGEAQKTLDGMAELTKRLKDSVPDVLLVLSPHQPYVQNALFLNSAPAVHGSFAPFGASGVSFDLPTSEPARTALGRHLAEAGVPVRTGAQEDLTPDHGTMVPLYFLRRTWGVLPPVILASPIGLTPKGSSGLGAALASFEDGRRWGLLASGDLSHRLIPGAPAGYSPKGREFDEQIVEALSTGRTDGLLVLSPDFLHEAGECGLRSVLALLAFCSERNGSVDLLSYEGPFGVGYSCAFCSLEARAPHPCAALAREVVRRHLNGLPPLEAPPTPADPLWARRAACFVTIKRRDGALRGCIGTLAPAQDSLFSEITANAVSAATQDPRFPPMRSDELEDVVFSVDVLSEPEPVSDMAQLDAAVWGVIVSKGGRRGVLLPDLEGVDDVATQLSVAARKAGIRDLEGVAVERFRVERCS
ncbi:MAG: AmmeMemoRadiSam system protein A [Fretibacterium sp.]|nr:AmmeMemoRadiSam system protein A [Fretibacterium sp.]